MYNTTIALPIS